MNGATWRLPPIVRGVGQVPQDIGCEGRPDIRAAGDPQSSGLGVVAGVGGAKPGGEEAFLVGDVAQQRPECRLPTQCGHSLDLGWPFLTGEVVRRDPPKMCAEDREFPTVVSGHVEPGW